MIHCGVNGQGCNGMELSHKAGRIWCAIAYYLHHTGVSPGLTDLELLTGGYLTASPARDSRTLLWLPMDVYLQRSRWPAPPVASLVYAESLEGKASESAAPG